MNTYEGLFLLRSDMKEEDIKNLTKQIADGIVKNGGTLQKEEQWGKRSTAYRLNKVRDGYYYKCDFTVPPDAIAKLDASYKLNDSILRVMITRK